MASATIKCSQFSWCDGHEPGVSVDGGHHATLTVGRYDDGTVKEATVWLMTPTPEFDEPERWEIAMPTYDEWVLGPNDLDTEIAEAVRELETTRTLLKAFLAEHGATEGEAR